MCGRYRLSTDPRTELGRFDLDDVLDRWDPFRERWNIAPSEPPLPASSERATPRRLTSVPIAFVDGDRAVGREAVWPLIPVWADGEVPKYSTANARSETMAEKNSYRHAWEHGQRCVLFADGFYEWQAVEGRRTKQPWCIHLQNEPMLAFGGLWERSRSKGGEDVLSCTIVTVEANPLMREIHNSGRSRHRMPLILPAGRVGDWLRADVDAARALVDSFPADEMAAYPVGTAINNPGHDDPKVAERVEPEASTIGLVAANRRDPHP